MRPFTKRDNTRYGKRHVPGVMNRTESEYAELLQVRKMNGEVIRWEFEAVTFKLAKDLRYTPDFMVWLASGEMEFVNVKGGGPENETSRVKTKAAAEKFPQFLFVFEKKLPKKDGGGWKREEF